jgi:hypothetical protein
MRPPCGNKSEGSIAINSFQAAAPLARWKNLMNVYSSLTVAFSPSNYKPFLTLLHLCISTHDDLELYQH